MEQTLNYSHVIDHTFLKDESQFVDLKQQEIAVLKLLDEAHRYQAYSVCIRKKWVQMAKRWIDEHSSSLKICSVVGFPLGDDYTTREICQDIQKAKSEGALEFDTVAKRELIIQRKKNDFRDDLLAQIEAADGLVLKIIFEMGALDNDQKVWALEQATRMVEELGMKAPALFFKTSTGFHHDSSQNSTGATPKDVSLMHSFVQGKWGIKPSGGIDSEDKAQHYFELIGCPLLNAKPNPKLFRLGSSSLLNKINTP